MKKSKSLEFVMLDQKNLNWLYVEYESESPYNNLIMSIGILKPNGKTKENVLYPLDTVELPDVNPELNDLVVKAVENNALNYWVAAWEQAREVEMYSVQETQPYEIFNQQLSVIKKSIGL